MPKGTNDESSALPPEKTNNNKEDIANDEFYHESKMNYSADQEYSSSFHDDAYNPETYNYYKGIMLSIQGYLDRFVIDNPQFDGLRTLDTSKLRPGDQIGLNIKQIGEFNCSGKVFVINEIGPKDIFIKHDDKVYVVKLGEIKILDEQILRLKSGDISFIYNDFKKNTKIESHVDFFYTFTEYFKINEKLLYESLSTRVKNEILEELDERTGCLKKLNVFNW